jgi:hypothetical protein
MPDGEMVAKALKNGFPMQASVGLRIIKAKYIEKEETIDVNGQEMPGPFFLVSKSKLIESSFVVNGADDQTMSIAASRGNLPSEDVMAKENAQTEDRAAVNKSIKAAFPKDPEFALDQICAGATLAEAKAAYADVLQARLEEQQEAHKAELEAARQSKEVEGARAGRSYSDPIAASGSSESEPRNVKAEWNALVAQKIKERGNRIEGLKAAARENPELHELFVAAANDGETFSDVKLRKSVKMYR